MSNTNIKFDKRKLESLKSSTKPTWYYAQNFEGLALVVGKKKKTYYAHWSIIRWIAQATDGHLEHYINVDEHCIPGGYLATERPYQFFIL